MAQGERYAPGKPFKFSELQILEFDCSLHMAAKELMELRFDLLLEFDSPKDLGEFMKGHIVADDGRVVGVPLKTSSNGPSSPFFEVNVVGRLYELPTVDKDRSWIDDMSLYFPDKCEHGCLYEFSGKTLGRPRPIGASEEDNYPTKFQPFDMKVQT